MAKSGRVNEISENGASIALQYFDESDKTTFRGCIFPRLSEFPEKRLPKYFFGRSVRSTTIVVGLKADSRDRRLRDDGFHQLVSLLAGPWHGKTDGNRVAGLAGLDVQAVIERALLSSVENLHVAGNSRLL
jgi:hypothetical protein